MPNRVCLICNGWVPSGAAYVVLDGQLTSGNGKFIEGTTVGAVHRGCLDTCPPPEDLEKENARLVKENAELSDQLAALDPSREEPVILEI